MVRRLTTAVLLVSLLFAVACGDDDDEGSGESGTTTAPSGEEASCEAADLPLKEEGTLTVATGAPAFSPWVQNDDPESGEGFEAALVYAVADELGLAKNVTWTRTGFDEAVSAGEKDYDLNIQQYSINAERDEVVDFSDGYYTVEQAIVGSADGDIADAASLEDLKGYRLGAAIGTTSLDYVEEFIDPDAEVQVYDDNAAAKAAFDANQVDGIVFDLPTAYYVTTEIEGSSIVGVLPQQGEAEELGMLFEDGSPLVPCVNEALATLEEDGTLADLESEWLDQGGDIPTLQG